MKYAWQSHSYGVLPNSGGLRDQSAKLMLRMAATYNVWNAFNQFKSSNFDPKWIKSHSGEWKIISEVEMLRAELQKVNGE